MRFPPLVIRNRIAILYRGLMLVWLCLLALETRASVRDGPPGADAWWPMIGHIRRREFRTDPARFWIEHTQDSDGAPYFELVMEAPERRLVVREGHREDVLEEVLQQIHLAVRD